jgi:lipoprotein-releasing system permease protein
VSLPFFIARRYFLSRRKKNFINIISLLSMAGVAFSTAALVIVLSVFNGLEGLLRSLYTSFDPQLKIEAVRAKTFEATPELISSIKRIDGVAIVTEVIEDYAYVKYRDAEMAAIIRGVSENFIDQRRLDNHIVNGKLQLRDGDVGFAIVGAGVQSTLSVAVEDDSHAMQVYYIKNAPTTSLDLSRVYSRKSIRPGGVFSIEKNYDENYIFLPLDFAVELLDYGNKRTFLEVKCNGENDVENVKRAIASTLGASFRVLTNEEQHKDLYRLLNMEKLFTFLALSMLILVGSINIFFSLMMLAIDKKKDVSILFALGAHPRLIRSIFLFEGGIISFLGAGIGLAAGGLICWLQDRLGLVGMGMENAIVAAYPVEMRGSDFLYIAAVVVVITLVISFYPAVLAARSTKQTGMNEFL